MLDFLFNGEALMGVALVMAAVFMGRLMVTVVVFRARLNAEENDLRLSQRILEHLSSDERRRILTNLKETDQ